MVSTAKASKVLDPKKIAIVGGANYDHFDGPKGLDIRALRDDEHRCAPCAAEIPLRAML